MNQPGRRCAICNEPIEKNGVTLTAKGLDGVNRASDERGDTIKVIIGDSVHIECRKRYTNPTQIAKLFRQQREDSSPSLKTLRSHRSVQFDFRRDCLFCGTEVNYEQERKRGRVVCTVRTMEIKDTVLYACNARCDEWGQAVQARIQSVHDLPAADAIYHQPCSTNFRMKLGIPAPFINDQPQPKKRKSGRPVDNDANDAFLKVAQYLQDTEEQVTVLDLTKKMEEFLGESHEASTYSTRYMKERILEHFGENVIITSKPGMANIVTFRRTAASILEEFHSQQNDQANPEDEKLNVIRTAAKLVRSDIKRIETPDDYYPLIDSDIDKHIEFLPPTLKVFLDEIFSGKDTSVKMAFIGQAIMQSSRPRALLAPLQIGMGVQMHHSFASRFLIDTLHHAGFSSSYSEVISFKRNAAVDQGTAIPDYHGEFSQYGADNLDHNLRTIDGHGTFHGTGIIAMVTPGTKRMNQVPRNKVTDQDILLAGQIEILPPSQPRKATLDIKFKEVIIATVEDPTANLDVLWKTSLLFKNVTRPNWGGFMQATQKGTYPGKSSISFLPMIDMSASDITCINSTLNFVYKHAEEHGIQNPIITYDQPLWHKAFSLINTESLDSKLRKIIPRLGSFHTLMSFLGSIGHLMAGSGLKELLELIYAPNAVEHMLSGKAVARALRGHFIVDASLNALLYSAALGVEVPCLHSTGNISFFGKFHILGHIVIKTLHITDNSDNVEVDEDNGDGSDTMEASCNTSDHEIPMIEEERLQETLISTTNAEDHAEDSQNESDTLLKQSQELYEELTQKKRTAQEVVGSNTLRAIESKVDKKRETFQAESRTAALWIQYQDMIDIVRAFIKAERTGNWEMHLQVLSRMLPYLAASGHNLYTESATLYLQSMNNLKVEFPEVYKSFSEGFHVVRRNDRYWAGLSTDLIIEQVLMRSVKTTGGLTRGSGMTEQQRVTWVLSTPACAQVSLAMQDLIGVLCEHSEQNKDMSKSRQKRDYEDTIIILKTISNDARNPFVQESVLKNIMTGVNADDSVDVDQAKTKGEKILEKMAGQKVCDYKFTRKEQAITLAAGTSVHIDGVKVHVDPQLLFQRLVFACNTIDDLEDVFKYELCSYPASLFDTPSTLRQPQKSNLADTLWDMLSPQAKAGPSGQVKYVIDGGALLHRVPWPKHATFREVCQKYCHYVKQKYGVGTVIVFDGYDRPTTKNMTQQRRSSGRVGATVSFEVKMKITMKRDVFLANSQNKKRLITTLRHYLELNGCETLQADGDADVLIVKTAITTARESPTVLVGDDTDLLVLLCYYTKLDQGCDLYFRPEPKTTSKRLVERVWNMRRIRSELGEALCQNILFLHAIAGCDTTSRPFGIGKSAPLKRFAESTEYRKQVSIFDASNVSVDEVVQAGEEVLVTLYGGKKGETLDSLRHRKYHEKVCTKGRMVEPQNLPPTSSAAKYHSMRVFLQIKQWQGQDECLSIEDWGWKLCKDLVVPITTDLPAAPETLLNMIRCNCATDCSTGRCTCRKHGLDCTLACGQCRGTGCTNSSVDPSDDDNQNDITEMCP